MAGSLTTPEMRSLHRAVLMGAGAEPQPSLQQTLHPLTGNLLRVMEERVQERWSKGLEKVCFGIELKSLPRLAPHSQVTLGKSMKCL